MALFKKSAPLSEKLESLEQAAEVGQAYLLPEQYDRLLKIADAGAKRRELSGDHTVVGFFGATGSGKTSLFNAVVGENLGKAAARRPTTSSPLAAVWHPQGSEELLDWLDVEDRRNRTGDFGNGTGPLILLDLPDFDSVEPENRKIATKLAGKVDVLVWVTDPEKYADTIIHDHFIKPHAAHSQVTLAVLNKADKLAEVDVTTVANSLEQLLVEDGLKKVRVIPTSAATGMGIEDLRKAIARVASAHTAQQARISADINSAVAPYVDNAGIKGLDKSAKKEMDTYLSDAAGVDRLADVTASAYRKRLGQKTGWLLTSWLLRLKADPLKRLGLREEADEIGVHRSSMPTLDASSKAVANKGVRIYAAAVSQGLPDQWASAVIDRSEAIVDELPEHLDRAVARTELPAQPSKGWSLFTFFQWLALVVALVGVLWYLAVAFVPGLLQPLLGDDLVPQVEGWPIPTLLIMGGLLLGVILGLLTAVFGGLIGAGIKRRTRKALNNEVAEVSAEQVQAPLLKIRNDYQHFYELVAKAGS